MDRCPNDPPCPHYAGLHDVYELGDPYPTCCVEGCRCGHPGDAIMHQDENGVVTVERADPVIRVTRGLLAAMLSDHYDPQSGRLRLDTAGEYVYEYLRPDPNESGCDLFGRVR